MGSLGTRETRLVLDHPEAARSMEVQLACTEAEWVHLASQHFTSCRQRTEFNANLTIEQTPA